MPKVNWMTAEERAGKVHEPKPRPMPKPKPKKRTQKSSSTESIRRLSVVMFRQAVADMKGETNHHLADNPKDAPSLRRRNFRARARATAWLASRQAAPYYDIIGLDQTSCLEGCEWDTYAERCLNVKSKSRLPADVRRLLTQTLRRIF